MTTSTLADRLAALAEQVADLRPEAEQPIRAAIVERCKARTYELPRKVTFSTEDAPLWIETHNVRDSLRGNVIDSVTVYVHGQMTCNGRDQRADVVIIRRFFEDTPRRLFSYTRADTMPDGAKGNVAAAVTATVADTMTAEEWRALAEETRDAEHTATVRRSIGEAVHSLEQAARSLTRYQPLPIAPEPQS
jgi:hypothetical protein